MLRIRMSHALLVALVVGLMLVPAGQSAAQEPAPAAPQTVADDEIAVIDSADSNRIRIVDPYQAPGITPFVWQSSDTGWGNVAAGDFNGDGDAELAAVRAGTLKIFDPQQQPGSELVTFETTLSGGRAFRLIATGDIDADGRDEIVVTHTDTGGQTLQLWDGGGTGANWSMVRSEFFAGPWDALSCGDMNNDGYDDVALERRLDQRIKVYSGRTWIPPLAEDSNFVGSWLTIALGNMDSSRAGDGMALAREGVDISDYSNLILYRLESVSPPYPRALVNLRDLSSYRYSPPFTSTSLGDVNGDGDDEVLLLRNPVTDKTALLLVNPVGASMSNFEQSIGYGSSAWNQVRTGDLDADGRDEVVVLRQNTLRIYWQAELDNIKEDFAGSFRVPSSVDSDRPTMAIANYDGQGTPGDGPMVVSPSSISVMRRAGTPTTVRTISITRTGASIGWVATENPDLPGVTLVPNSGVTPGTITVNINTSVEGIHQTSIRVLSTTPGVSNPDQYVPLTIWVGNDAVFLPLVLK